MAGAAVAERAVAEWRLKRPGAAASARRGGSAGLAARGEADRRVGRPARSTGPRRGSAHARRPAAWARGAGGRGGGGFDGSRRRRLAEPRLDRDGASTAAGRRGPGGGERRAERAGRRAASASRRAQRARPRRPRMLGAGAPRHQLARRRVFLAERASFGAEEASPCGAAGAARLGSRCSREGRGGKVRRAPGGRALCSTPSGPALAEAASPGAEDQPCGAPRQGLGALCLSLMLALLDRGTPASSTDHSNKGRNLRFPLAEAPRANLRKERANPARRRILGPIDRGSPRKEGGGITSG